MPTNSSAIDTLATRMTKMKIDVRRFTFVCSPELARPLPLRPGFARNTMADDAPPRAALYSKPGKPWRHASLSILPGMSAIGILGDIDVGQLPLRFESGCR